MLSSAGLYLADAIFDKLGHNSQVANANFVRLFFLLAERGLAPRTSVLSGQHASTAPPC